MQHSGTSARVMFECPFPLYYTLFQSCIGLTFVDSRVFSWTAHIAIIIDLVAVATSVTTSQHLSDYFPLPRIFFPIFIGAYSLIKTLHTFSTHGILEKLLVKVGFSSNRQLYKQVDRRMMGSSSGPVLANKFVPLHGQYHRGRRAANIERPFCRDGCYVGCLSKGKHGATFFLSTEQISTQA